MEDQVAAQQDASLHSSLNRMRNYFTAGETRSYAFRRKKLQDLKAALYRHEEKIYAALQSDLKKNREECWVTEIGFTVAEINYAIAHLRRWMRPKKVGTNLLNFPGSSYIVPEPLGVVLIIGPWNYPLQLLLAPLAGAIAAGNAVVLKPSEMAPATAKVLRDICTEIFDPAFVRIVEGNGAEVIPEMMNHFRFDHVFYTGSTQVGKIIYEMAARQLVPVTLELGGKSPCIIERDADLTVTARRIALTKFSNAGQMCVAPDYLLVHEEVRKPFLEELKKYIFRFYNEPETRAYHFGKIINERQFNRLVGYLKEGTIVYGGSYDATTHFMEPTLIENVTPDSRIMNEEIFGPVLPIISWKEDHEVYQWVAQHPNPLALYVFTQSETRAAKWTQTIPFGGGCINNASWHLTNHRLPFGGRGNSGMGAYHGRHSFDTFSHRKGILKTPVWFDPSFKYPPFRGKLNLFKKFIR